MVSIKYKDKQHAEEGNGTAGFNYRATLAITAINLSPLLFNEGTSKSELSSEASVLFANAGSCGSCGKYLLPCSLSLMSGGVGLAGLRYSGGVHMTDCLSSYLHSGEPMLIESEKKYRE